MGLHITQKIVETLNGKITVNSDLGKGSEFIVTFNKYEKQTGDVITINFELTKPIDNNFLTNEELLSQNVFDHQKKTLLIVEDNLQLVINLKNELEEMYNIYFGTNGTEALEKLKTLPVPDIIISDIMMDVMDGYEFREQLLNSKKYKAIPFVFLTAKNKKDEKLHGLSQGAVDYICKPFELYELKEKVKNWLLLIELKGFSAETELKSKHQSRLENFIKEYRITLKEKEVLNYLLQGYKNNKIAEKMFISANTVKKHIERIKAKLHVIKKDELIKYLYDYVYK
jgi:DNA-binding NarL/FixJ family response regulator